MYTSACTAEVRAIRGRHVDVGGRLIIPGTKTKHRYRAVTLAVPELVELLEKRAQEVGMDGFIVDRSGTGLLAAVRRYARKAKIDHADQLCFHSLRGSVAAWHRWLAARLTWRSGLWPPFWVTPATRMTRQHYATANSQAQRQSNVSLKVLSGGLVSKPDDFETKAEKA